MKILKIELQNINSLKSNQPIVIDFESDEFKDVGLFAITGPTGAGKSTILDAITIALYRKIPRFNNAKGSLVDVVSFGASNALSRVTFLNNNEIFEASWHIRVANNSGKKLKKPSEEVRLKNLTTKKIISNKLNTIAKEVENVTQLNYEQFLRSVMLAQGEFASFLSAKGPKKGELLEQITGEDIYKKIGQQILDRRNAEIKKLEQLNSKINNDDILSEEDKIALKKQEKEINTELKNIENQLKSLEKITNWYANFNQLQEENKQLNLKSEELNQNIKTNQSHLNRLSLHQKAEPFKDFILNINRIEKTNLMHTQSIKEIDKELTLIKPKLTALTEKEKSTNKQLKTAENLFNEWLPQFDEISTLDSNIKNLKKDLENTKDEIKKNNDLKNNLITKNIELNKELEVINIDLKNSKEWIEKNHFLLEVNAILPQWISDLTTLKNTSQQLNENKKLHQEKTEQLTQTNLILLEKNQKINQETKQLKDIDAKIIEIDEKIKTHQLKDVNLNEKKDQLNTQLNTLNQLKNLSESFIKINNKIDELKQKSTTNKRLLKDKQQHLTHLLKQIDKQNELIKSNEDNLKLKRSIKNYEQDRKELVEGKECPLCGSKEHPFASHLKAFNLSDDEQKLNLLKKELSELELNKNKLNNEITVINTKFDANTEEINHLTTQINDIKQSKKELNIDIDLSNTIKINTEINLLNQQIKDVNSQIEFKFKLQEQKDNFKQSFDNQKEKVDKLNIEIAALTQKKEIIEKNLKNLTNTVNHLTNEESKTQQQLTKEVSEFNYQLPPIEKIDAFIESVKNNISNFQKTNENLSNLQHKIAQIKTNIKHNNTAIEEKEQLLKNKTELLKTIESKLKQIENQRASLLPFNVSVEEKRKELSDNKNSVSKKLKEIVDEIKTLEHQQNKQQTLLKKFQTDLEKSRKELEHFNTQLQQQLKSSDFDSKQSIENALLSVNDYEQLKQLQDNFKERQIEIKTLKSKNKNLIEQLLKQKDFNVSEEESTEQLNQLKQKNKELIGSKGEIKEKFRKDEDIKKRNQLIYNQIKEQEKICNVWRDLFKIIGNSKDAFNTYVQRLTLKQLLELANVHLYRLNKRYSLKMQDNYKPKEELNFNLIDHYQTDQARLVDTSSGGEKFIISLALALGLSDLASKNVKIDSLFIDEGFGTLDSNALETVISTLETLQSHGKMIGVISHVENLKERITRQIKINKKSNGVSSVEII